MDIPDTFELLSNQLIDTLLHLGSRLWDGLRRSTPEFVRRRYALKFAIALLILGLSVGAIGTVATALITDQVEQNAQEEFESVAKQEAATLKNWHLRNERLVEFVAKSRAVEAGNETRIRESLDRWAADLPSTAHHIHYVDTTTGEIVVSTDRAATHLDDVSFPMPAAELQTFASRFVKRTDPYVIDREAQLNVPVMAYVRQVTNRPDRAVVYTVNLRTYSSQFQSVSRDTPVTMIVTRNGTVVLDDQFLGGGFGDVGRVSESEATAGSFLQPYDDRSGVLAAAREADPITAPGGSMTVGERPGQLLRSNVYEFDAKGYLVAYYVEEETGWVVLVHQSIDDAYGPVQNTSYYGTLATVAGVLLIGLVGAVLARNTARSIDQLTAKATRMEAGDLEVAFESDRIDNIGRLYRAFGKMQETVRAHVRESALVESASDLITQVDDDGEITFQSPSVRAILGYEPDEMVGRPFQAFVHDDDRPVVDSALDRPDRGSRFEFRVRDASGEWRILEGASEELLDNPFVEGTVITSRDITNRKEREQALERTKDELERSNEALQQFAYIASHDLREPLRMVSSYLDLLAAEYGGELDDEADEYIEFAVDGAERMQDMIAGLLEYSRVRTHGGGFSEVDPHDVLANVRQDLALLIEEADASITVDDLPTVYADENQLGQLFQNLLQNAIEHAGEGPPEIHVDADRRDGEFVFSVADNGVGVPDHLQDRIFEMFQQGSHDNAGTGIGLAICSRIVDRHGGDIWVESPDGDGATFYFTLPEQSTA